MMMPRRMFSRMFSSSKVILSLLLFSAVLGAVGSPAEAAILVEDGGRSAYRRAAIGRIGKTASDGMSLRRVRRVGIGLNALGALGLGGVNLELCFSPENAFVGGFGGGPGFQAYMIQYKRMLGSGNFLPYFAAGFSSWYSSGSKTSYDGGSTPGILADKLLSDGQRTSGKFSLNMLYPALGVQVMQPSGPWAGTSVYFEITMLAEISRLVAAPTGALGLMYYF